MYFALVRSAIFLLIGSHLWLVDGMSSSNSRSHQRKEKRHTRGVRARRRPRATDQSDVPCFNQTSCRYITAMLEFPPYVMNGTTNAERGFLYENIMWFVEEICLDIKTTDEPPTCCMESLFVNSSEELVRLVKDKKVDFAFPVLTQMKKELKDIPYATLIRAFVANGCSLIVNTKQCEAESREQLLFSITSQWPILACILLLSGIAGVVIWLLEHRTNKKQFSSSFTNGSPEGFWWAVVSLTTVGYGDRTPKTFLGRTFGVVWIFVGAIMLSLFTALFTNAMQAALDGTRCRDIDSKVVGVSSVNPEAQEVAKIFDAKVKTFNSIGEMQRNLSSGDIGRVLVDRNTAFHFLDKSGLKRNRQIRLIRHIDYPMDYYMVHVNREIEGSSEEYFEETFMSPSYNDTDEAPAKPDPEEQKQRIAQCGPWLKEMSKDLIGAAKQRAAEQVIPAELQTAGLSDEIAGLFSTGSEMTNFILFFLLGVFLSLIVIGVLWEAYERCNAAKRKRAQFKGSPSLHGYSDKGNLIPLNKNFSMMQSFVEMEERLRDLTTDLQKMKEEFAGTIGTDRALRGRNRQCLDQTDQPDKGRSFFDMLNRRSKNPETVL